MESVDGPHRMDIVPIERIRLSSAKCSPIKQSEFKQTKISVPDDLRAYFKRPGSYDDFVITVKNIFVEYDEESAMLLVSVCLHFCFLFCFFFFCVVKMRRKVAYATLNLKA